MTGKSDEATVKEPADDPLWVALKDHAFDDPDSALTFSARLASENRWPRRYADAVIDEYRKFCYLAQRADHPVTPSDEVDQVWHLHLIYSEAYRAFCDTVLGTHFDHGPTKGGNDEASKFRGWYGDTLKSYRAIFGEPPEEIWPPIHARFAHADQFVRVNRAQYWLVPRMRRGTALGLIIGIVGLIVIFSR